MRLSIIVCLAWCIGFLNLNSSAENSAAKPVPLDEGWLQQHEHFNALAKAGDIDILFLGDSLVTSWMGDGVGLKARGKAVWDKNMQLSMQPYLESQEIGHSIYFGG